LSNFAPQIVVDFSAAWCGPCRMISPEFEKLSNEFTNIVFLKIDIDEVDVSIRGKEATLFSFSVHIDGRLEIDCYQLTFHIHFIADRRC
jgi:thiol-disulfide isomerase/thioredoxin